MAAKNVIDILVNAKDNASKGLNRNIKSVKDLRQSARELAPAFKLAAAAAVTATAAMIKSWANTADETAKFARSVGSTTEEISTLQHAADQAGVSNFHKAMRQLNGAISDTQKGVGYARDRFESLGIAVEDSSGHARRSTDVLKDLADAYASGIIPETELAGVAMDIFGKKVGQEMVPFLMQGRDGLEAMQQEARELGIELDSGAAEAAEQFNDNMDRLSKASKGLVNQFAQNLMPALVSITESFGRGGEEASGMQRAAEAMGKGVGQTIRGIAAAVEGGIFVVKQLGNLIANFLNQSMIGFKTLGNVIKAVWNRDFGAIGGIIRDGANESVKAVDWFKDEVKADAAELNETWKTLFSDPAPSTNARKTANDVSEALDEAASAAEEADEKAIESARRKEEALRESLQRELDAIDHRLRSQAEREQHAYQRQLASLEQALEMQLLTEQEHDARREALKADHLARLDEMTAVSAHNREAVEVNSAASTLGGLASIYGDLTSALSSEQGKQFGLQKAAAISQAKIQTALAATKAYQAMVGIPVAGPGLAIAAAAAATAAGLANVATIATQQPVGMAHSGISNIPQEGTWLLDRGERVLSREQNRDLSDFMDKGQSVKVFLDGRQILSYVSKSAKNGELTIDGRAIR